MRHFEANARRYGVALASQFEFPQVVAEAGVEEGSLAQGERSELLLACGERARQPASNLFQVCSAYSTSSTSGKTTDH